MPAPRNGQLSVNSPVWYDKRTLVWWANHLAQRLLEADTVHTVEMFGSLARNEGGPGSDIDIIVVADEGLVSLWLAACDFNEGDDGYTSFRLDRLLAAAEVLGANWLAEGWDTSVDVFVFPPDWRNRLQELQSAGRHHDPDFMRNLSRDAVAYNPDVRSFPLPDFLKYVD